ncbi:MAG: acetate kinase [Phycisphaerales bacterium]|nr:MAG: acetate kinase [Phycisphaerales bacterium]
MRILVINCGSSSVKYKLFDAGREYQVLVKGTANKIGFSDSVLSHQGSAGEERTIAGSWPSHREALKAIFKVLAGEKGLRRKGGWGVDVAGHRVVHGGSLTRAVLVDADVIRVIKGHARYAPLHNPANLAGIEICQDVLVGVPNVAVFDTAAHHTVPEKAHLYALPRDLCAKHNIRRYGFHGISHRYAASKAAEALSRSVENLRIVTCHLGSGSSVTAFKDGKSIDTSMGLTTFEGVVMSTRSGDVDPGILLYFMEDLGLGAKDIRDILSKKSGLKGLCGKSDMRDVLAAAHAGDKASQLAIDVFVYRIQKYVGAYVAAMDGVDAIVFTAGIGENSPYLRAKILANFKYLGLRIDKEKNRENMVIFSPVDSKVRAMTIPANEELSIAQLTYETMTGSRMDPKGTGRE